MKKLESIKSRVIFLYALTKQQKDKNDEKIEKLSY